MYENRQTQQRSVEIHQPFARCPYNDGFADGLVLGQVIDYYAETLRASEKALSFLVGRGIADPQALRTFRLGFADRTLGLQLRKLDHLQEETVRGALQRLGMLKQSGHELFRGAIVFPIQDQNGLVVGGYGRRITPKLCAHSAYHVHWRLEQNAFFNQTALFEFPEVVLCKSPLEALSWWCHGVHNVVAVVGFEGFEEEHLRLLTCSSVRLIYIAFGGSRPEMDRCRKIARLLVESCLEVRVVFYPAGMDASSFVTSVNDVPQELLRLLDESLAFQAREGGEHGH